MQSVVNERVSVGVITHDRATLFVDCLKGLSKSIARSKYECEVLVINNAGADGHSAVSQMIIDSEISKVCSVRTIESPINNISVGRNLAIENAAADLLMFIDDDECPHIDWIDEMVEQMKTSDSAVVVGPIYAMFPEGTTAWISQLDIHNNNSLQTGQKIRRSATGNCLLNLSEVGDLRFDEAFGRTGGGDSLFFDELWIRGKPSVWCNEGKVFETIPEDRANARYMIFRFLKQGFNYRRVVLRNASTKQKTMFFVKAVCAAPVSLTIGLFAIPFSPRVAAKWIKRGFINLGKIKKSGKLLYG